MIRYKKIVSIAMSIVVMATLFSTNVFACNCISSYTIDGDILTLQKGGKAKLRDKIQNAANIRQAIVRPGITSLVGTFEGFTCLEEVTFADNSELEEIGDNAFKNCTNLRRITIPGSVRTIGKEAFSGCENLETVTIEQIDERRNNYAYNAAPDVFAPAPEEQSIEIKDNAFLSCKKLERVIIISNNVASIGKNAFMDCKSLKSITNSQNNNNNRDIITIPNIVTSIGENAFSGCTRLKEITIPNSINKISEGTFQGCTRLRSVTISDSVTDIGEWAFKDCEKLETINIPNSVETIDTDAFRNCKNLKNIKISFFFDS